MLQELDEDEEARSICRSLNTSQRSALNAAALARVTVRDYAKQVERGTQATAEEGALNDAELGKLQERFSATLKDARGRVSGPWEGRSVAVVECLALQARAGYANARQEREEARTLHQAAVDLARRELAGAPHHRRLCLRLLESQRQLGDVEGALQTVARWLARYSRDPEFLALQGALRAASDSPNLNAALDDFAESIRRWPNYVRAYGQRAEVRLEAVVAEEAGRGRRTSERARRAWNLARDDLGIAARLCKRSSWQQRAGSLLDQLAETGR